MQEKIDVLFDMESNDPDDVMTLCMLSTHPRVNLRAVTCMPGGAEQVGLIHYVLKRTEHEPIPIGAYNPDFEKNCVSGFHHKWLGNWKAIKAEQKGYEVINEMIQKYPKLNILTGGPLKNFRRLDPELKIHRWVGQGGFAGDNIVPPSLRLAKFAGMKTCPTFNFNGDPKTALKLLESPNIQTRHLVSKNLCHGVVYNRKVHEWMHPHRDRSAGVQLIYKGMDKYLARKEKKFHDPLAACALIEPEIFKFKEVELYRSGGKWGSREQEGSRTFISVSVNEPRFWEVLVGL